MTEILALLIYVKVHVNSKYFKMLLKTPKDTTSKLYRRELYFQDTLVQSKTYTPVAPPMLLAPARKHAV